MRKLSLLGMSLAFALSSTAAMADSNSFQALSEMPNAEAVSSMTNKQLSAVEGTYYFDICSGCVNLAGITQGNLSVFGGLVMQSNVAGISQEIN